MVVGFDLAGSAGVVIDGGFVDGSVALNGALSYTGPTRIVSGALRADGSLEGDFDSNNSVNGGDFLDWQRAFPVLGAADLDDWQENFGANGPVGSLPTTSAIPI